MGILLQWSAIACVRPETHRITASPETAHMECLSCPKEEEQYAFAPHTPNRVHMRLNEGDRFANKIGRQLLTFLTLAASATQGQCSIRSKRYNQARVMMLYVNNKGGQHTFMRSTASMTRFWYSSRFQWRRRPWNISLAFDMARCSQSRRCCSACHVPSGGVCHMISCSLKS